MSGARGVGWVGVLLAMACGATARADEPATATNEGAAIERFDAGLRAMLAGDHANGCPALAESYRLDPALGSLFTLAECEKDWGKTASAGAHYQAFLDRYRALPPAEQRAQQARAQVARQALASIGPRIPRLRIDLAAGWPSGAEVLDDGAPVPAADIGVARRVDPGRHVIEVRAAGVPTHRSEVRVDPGSLATITVPAPVRAGAAANAGAPQPRDAAVADPGIANGDTQRGVALVLGGVGLAGIAVGAVAGAIAMGDASTAHDDCSDDRVCATEEGKDAAERAQGAALISTVGFIGGAALLASGVVLYVIAPRGEAPRTTVGVRGTRGGAMAAAEVRW